MDEVLFHMAHYVTLGYILSTQLKFDPSTEDYNHVTI